MLWRTQYLLIHFFHFLHRSKLKDDNTKVSEKNKEEIEEQVDVKDEDEGKRKEATTPSNIMEEDNDIKFFKNTLTKTNDALAQNCNKWNLKMDRLDKTNITKFEDICGKIRSTIGKANLLMNKKGRFEQFRTLIE